jgi:transposase InsO family protein
MEAEDMALAPRIVMRDNGRKFTPQFDDVLESSGVSILRTTPRSPNLRAHVERFIQSLKGECLDKFVIVGERHLNHINRQWQQHYNQERPHSARDHLPPGYHAAPAPAASVVPGDVVSTSRLGGLLKHYHRRAA